MQSANPRDDASRGGTNVKLGGRLLGLAALGLIGVLVLFLPTGSSGTAQTQADTELEVYSISLGTQSLTAIAVRSEEPASSVRVSVPGGYTIDLAQPAGTKLGEVSAFLRAAGGSSGAFVDGELVVDDPVKYAADESAQACAPGAHAAVWRAELRILGQSYGLPIFVDAGGSSSAEPAAILSFCPRWLASGVPGLVADYLTMYVEGVLSLPRAPGLYTWNALLTPALSGSLEPDPSRAFELRALIAHPHALTLHARHDPKAKSVVLSGRLTAVGRPEPGAKVFFSAYLDSPDDITSFGPVTTNASGKFSVRRRIENTTQYSASVRDLTRPCSAPSTAPRGCLNETVSAPLGAYVTVRVRGPLEAKLELRAREQALARRINLKLSDFPDGWEAYPIPTPFFPCPGFEPNLSKLTVRGEAESPVFITEEDTAAVAAAWSSTSIYVSEPQARTAFDREARLAAARCLAAEAKRDGTTIQSVAPISFPRLANQTRAFRIVYSDPEESGYLDLVSIRQGRVVVRMTFVATDELAIERGLAVKVAARARAR